MPASINYDQAWHYEQKFCLNIILGRHLCLLGLVPNYAGCLEDVALSILIMQFFIWILPIRIFFFYGEKTDVPWSQYVIVEADMMWSSDLCRLSHSALHWCDPTLSTMSSVGCLSTESTSDSPSVSRGGLMMGYSVSLGSLLGCIRRQVWSSLMEILLTSAEQECHCI